MYSEERHCYTCKRETRHTNIEPDRASTCDDCTAREYAAKEAAWQTLSTEEKIEQLRKRVVELEQTTLY